MNQQSEIVIKGRSEYVDPANATVEHTVDEDGVNLRLSDESHHDFWLHIEIPAHMLLEWYYQSCMKKNGLNVPDSQEEIKRG